MTRTVSVNYRPRAGSFAAIGTAGDHEVVADRPAGVAGGQGMGMNGAELLALSLGGCLWNDLHYAAAKDEISITVEAIDVEIDIEGDPMRLPRARVQVAVSSEGAGHAQRAFDRAVAASALVAALKPGMELDIARVEAGV